MTKNTKPTDSTKKCPDCNGLPGLYPKNRCPACHVKSNIDNNNTDRLDEILAEHREWMRGIRTDHLVGTSNKETKQALLQWVSEAVVGKLKAMPKREDVIPDIYLEVLHRTEGQNAVIQEQRNILKQHGFKEDK